MQAIRTTTSVLEAAIAQAVPAGLSAEVADSLARQRCEQTPLLSAVTWALRQVRAASGRTIECARGCGRYTPCSVAHVLAVEQSVTFEYIGSERILVNVPGILQPVL